MCPQAIITYPVLMFLFYATRWIPYCSSDKKSFLENLHKLIYSSDVKVPVSTYHLWYGVCYLCRVGKYLAWVSRSFLILLVSLIGSSVAWSGLHSSPNEDI
jgi:hypothetical protein